MRPTTKTIPARLAAGASGTLLAIGCSGDPIPPSGPPPPPPPSPTFSVSGFVAEAGIAVADATVGAWVETKTWGGPRGSSRTDGQGWYQFGGMPLDARAWLIVHKQGYVQQCAAGPILIGGDATVDLELVSRTKVTASSRQSAAGLRTVTGIVSEMTPTGLQPMAGIYVQFPLDPSGDVSAADTYTDPNGKFALCGLPGSEAVMIGAWGTANRYKFVNVPPGQDNGVEIILP